LPKSVVDKILVVKIDGQFSSVAAELREAYASGPLGQKIFGRAVALVLDSKLEEIIRKQIQAMLAKAKITGEDALACKRAIASMVEALPGVDAVICSKGCFQPDCPPLSGVVLVWMPLLQQWPPNPNSTSQNGRQARLQASLLTTGKVPDRREIQTESRGWDIKVQVSCISEQVDVEIAAALQGLAVDVGMLEPLYCEAELMQGGCR
jgi:hypothetical protein